MDEHEYVAHMGRMTCTVYPITTVSYQLTTALMQCKYRCYLHTLLKFFSVLPKQLELKNTIWTCSSLFFVSSIVFKKNTIHFNVPFILKSRTLWQFVETHSFVVSLFYLKKVRKNATRWWLVYCDKQPQHGEGITGAGGRRKRRRRMRNEVADRWGRQGEK